MPMARRGLILLPLALCLSLLAGPRSGDAIEPAVLESVASVLPRWPTGGGGGGPGDEPEGSAVAIAPGGHLVTALHVVDRATAITVRLHDGRRLAGRLVGRDPASDLALIKIDAELPLLPIAPPPGLGMPVCAIGNQFGLDLSVTCGVVSAVRRSGVGFNPIEDFIQTDAAVNPGASGGALVDRGGRLVGVLSAIFTKQSDANIGVNFAVSTALVRRVVDDLLRHGRVIRADPGFAVGDLGEEESTLSSGARVHRVAAQGAAARAGLRQGDVVIAVAGRPVRRASDVTAAIHLSRPGESVLVRVVRNGATEELLLSLPE